MSRLLIQNVRVICPFNSLDAVGDILLEDGRIAEVRPGGGLEDSEARVFDCTGMVAAPGFVDLHVHLREPGEEQKETIKTGVTAALAGGFTTICAMPNTLPALDSRITVETVIERSRGLGVHVYPIGAVTVGRQGERLTSMSSLADAGVVAFSDDGSPVSDAGIMRRALEYSSMTGLPISSHAEELALSEGGSMHEGAVSARLGLKGVPAAAEEVMVRRDIALAEMTGGRLHIAHVSTVGAVEAVRNAKARGIAVTAEATPHHLLLTDEWAAGWGSLDPAGVDRSELGESAYDTSTKVNPPIRSREHVAAVVQGLLDGTIDAIATDHAPHSVLDKECEYGCSAFGISGLETALGLTMSLVHSGKLKIEQLVSLLTIGPATAFNLPAKGIRSGERAEIAVFDPEREWVVDAEALESKGKNSPLRGQRLRGQVMLTLAGDREYIAPGMEAK